MLGGQESGQATGSVKGHARGQYILGTKNDFFFQKFVIIQYIIFSGIYFDNLYVWLGMVIK